MFNLQTVNDMEGFNSTKGGFNGTILPKGSGGGGGGEINVIDNLNSDSATDALSAKQGKALKGLVDGKVDKVTGKGLSTNDYTTEDKGKVATALQPSALTPYRTELNQDTIDNAIKRRLDAIEGKESGWDAKADPTNVYSSIPAGGMLPDAVYHLGVLTGSVNLLLENPLAGRVNHYFFTFETGENVPTIVWDSKITSWQGSWTGGPLPVVAANSRYEVSVLTGVAIIMEV